jgi:hypothetical protein
MQNNSLQRRPKLLHISFGLAGADAVVAQIQHCAFVSSATLQAFSAASSYQRLRVVILLGCSVF